MGADKHGMMPFGLRAVAPPHQRAHRYIADFLLPACGGGTLEHHLESTIMTSPAAPPY